MLRLTVSPVCAVIAAVHLGIIGDHIWGEGLIGERVVFVDGYFTATVVTNVVAWG